MNKQTKLAIAAASMIAISATAFAAKTIDQNDATLPPQGVISLQQAIQTAQQHVKGSTATRSEYEHNKQGAWVVDVEMVNGQQVTDVQVDALKNIVITAKADQVDQEEQDAQD